MRKKDLTGFVEARLRRALSRSLLGDLRNAIKTLQTELQTTYEYLIRTSVQWMTTHGDVWGPNVHMDGEKVGFTDLCNSFAPATVDLVMVQHRWLMNDLTEGRSLKATFRLAFVSIPIVPLPLTRSGQTLHHTTQPTRALGTRRPPPSVNRNRQKLKARKNHSPPPRNFGDVK